MEWYVPISYTTILEANYKRAYAKAWLTPGETLKIPNVFNYFNNGIFLNIDAEGN